MGMSYSKAWRLIRTLEERLGFDLLERKVGGQLGGGSWITPQAKDLMNHYQQFRRDVEKGLNKIYQKHFGSPSHPLPTAGIPLLQGERGRVRGRGDRK
jgi:molybdate transport system regulatory protein